MVNSLWQSIKRTLNASDLEELETASQLLLDEARGKRGRGEEVNSVNMMGSAMDLMGGKMGLLMAYLDENHEKELKDLGYVNYHKRG